MNIGFAPSSSVFSVLPGRKPILTYTQQTEGYLPSTQLQHITTNITLVTLTTTNTSNHRCLWLIRWIQNVCNMFHFRILEFSNVTLIYVGNMCLQSVWNHSPNSNVTTTTTRTLNYTATRNQNLACIHLYGSHSILFIATQTTLIQLNTTQVYLFSTCALHVCYMFQPVHRTSSGMSIQQIL